MLTAFQPKRAGRLFVHTVTSSTSFELFTQRYFRGSLAVLITPFNTTLFIVIVFIQLALNAYGYFKNNKGQEVKDRKDINRRSCTQPDSEKFGADVSVNEGDRNDPFDEASSRNIYSPPGVATVGCIISVHIYSPSHS
ncbi:hypothetical protein BDR07DRAFT_577743 [Suillus spraguei]|nr:hypothetical protein BDR07DRAFT_577743 [Suillus spraguei]